MLPLSVMPLRLYNTFSKREEEFISLEPGEVRMYTCGPTVYGRPHVGNYASFLMADLLRRWFEVGHGYHVHHVKNITDVGHLLHDADHGDDKIQKEAEKQKMQPLDIARRYENEFLDDECALNILDSEARPRASAFIKEQLAMVRTLLEKGKAYETDDGIYFAVTTFPQYGALSGNTLENLSAGVRVDINEKKKHPADFALWKKCVGENAKHVLRWSFTTGEPVPSTGEDASAGFPGWHIECSAMSAAILGPQIDLHTGGEDNIFPHHECEIAQSESVTGKKPFVRYWLHRRRINMGSEKMSKSLGNMLTLSDIQNMGYSPLDLRYYLLSVHYRTHLKFTKKGLGDAHIARRRILDWIVQKGMREFGQRGSPNAIADFSFENVKECYENFKQAMDNDLNTPAALGAVFECMNSVNSSSVPDTEGMELLENFAHLVQETFGCFESEEEVPQEVEQLLVERTHAREEKDFAASDRLRDAIQKYGFEVRDTPQGQEVKKL